MNKYLFLTIIISFLSTYNSFGGGKLKISKGDTICLLNVQSQIINRTQKKPSLDSDITNIAADYVYQKTKKILSPKYDIVEGPKSSPLTSEQFMIFEKTYEEYNKSKSDEITLPEKLKPIFTDASCNYQLQIVQFGQYFEEDRKKLFTQDAIYLSNGNNTFYFILVDKLNNQIIYFEKSKSFADARDKEQIDRQILKCLRKLYYN